MYIFGLLGFEQVFIRLSSAGSSNIIKTQNYQIKSILWISLFTSITGTISFKYLFSEIPINFILLFIATYSISNLMLIFTIFRLNSDFFIAQIIVNFWKIILFFISIFLLKFEFLFPVTTILLIVIIIGFLISLYFLRKTVIFQYNKDFSKNEIQGYFLHFFLSILIFSFLSFGDRFIFNEMFGIKEFGDYYYLCNFFLAPFSIFQNYIGFKHIIQFKESFNKKMFNKLIFKIICFGLILILILSLISYFIFQYKILSFNFSKHIVAISLLLLIGLTKLYYAAIAALFEAIATKNTIKLVNIYFLLFLIFNIIIGVIFIKTIAQLIFMVLLVWLFRCFIFRLILFKQYNKD